VSRELRGHGVAQGVVIGRAHLLAPSEFEVRQFHIDRGDVLHEVARLNNAFSLVREELNELRADVASDAPAEVRAFLDLHRMILDDSLLCDAPRDLVRTRLINAEWALTIQLEEVCQQFELIDDEYFRSRSQDVRQVVERVLRRLAGGRPSAEAVERRGAARGEPLVLVAHDLAPADMLHVRRNAGDRLAGFVTELGGATSHTMILARSLGLPAIVGVSGARARVHEGDLLIVDSDAGQVIVSPDEETLARYRALIEEQGRARSELRKLRGKLARTRDGVPIELLANIELPEDVRYALDAGADGVGLFRTEFLFMNRTELPTEDEQYEAYVRVARLMKGKPVVIRTLDVGADKVLAAPTSESALEAVDAEAGAVQPNPALGLRAIRYCLAYPELFLTQLRAILRASAHGTVRILVPMLAHTHEIEQALAFVARAREQLKERRQKCDARVPVGGMIEVPAAALTLTPFLSRLKFLSIGTNDLIQYTLAIDRADSSVAQLYEPLHPAVLQLVQHTIRMGGKARVPVSVCGEMAGSLECTQLLLGMGLRRFSMNPAQILSVKQHLYELDTGPAGRLAARVARLHDPAQVRAALGRAARAAHAPAKAARR
jgi:phosphotransferase system enzyme I (PtsI)